MKAFCHHVPFCSENDEFAYIVFGDDKESALDRFYSDEDNGFCVRPGWDKTFSSPRGGLDSSIVALFGEKNICENSIYTYDSIPEKVKTLIKKTFSKMVRAASRCRLRIYEAEERNNDRKSKTIRELGEALSDEMASRENK